MQDLIMKLECPRCKAILHAPQGTQEVECNCHLFCPDGSKPSDCSVTTVSFTGQLGYPTGMHTATETEGNNTLAITYYCSTHNRYYYKTPIIIPLDWSRWFSRRAPKRLRQSHGEY